MRQLVSLLIFACLLSLSINRVALGQTNIFPLDGPAGIGTTSPAARLDVRGPGDALMQINDSASGNRLIIGTDSGLPTFLRLRPQKGAGFAITNDGDLIGVFVRGADGNVGVGTTDPQSKLDIAGTTRTRVLEITGGSDLAKPFKIVGSESIEPGMVVRIDPEHPGQLLVADKAYDRTAAGIISGANGLNPGLTMQQENRTIESTSLVALTGRVYCWADTSNGSIRPGDLLTTSKFPGHAMKVTDYPKAQGAIIGKAMTSLEAGRGLVLVLVALQ